MVKLKKFWANFGLIAAALGLFSCNKTESDLINRGNALKTAAILARYDFISSPIQVVAGSLGNTRMRFTNTGADEITYFKFHMYSFNSISAVKSIIPLDSTRYKPWSTCRELSSTSAECEFSFNSGQELKPGASVEFGLLWHFKTLSSIVKINIDSVDFCLKNKSRRYQYFK